LDDSVLLVEQEGENIIVWDKSEAVLNSLKYFRFPWPVVAKVLRWCPEVMRRVVYNSIARNRYNLFGKKETCIVPSKESKNRFLDWEL